MTCHYLVNFRMSQSQVVYKSIPISVDKSPGDFEAIALYDNQSESSDELNFKKGEILKILERDFHGLAGWWLCALRDKIGLAPGNRLEIIGNTPEKPQNFRTSDSNHIGITELTKVKVVKLICTFTNFANYQLKLRLNCFVIHNYSI